MVITAKHAIADPSVTEEVFGPSTLGIIAEDKAAVLNFAKSLQGHLTATIHGTDEDMEEYIIAFTQNLGRNFYSLKASSTALSSTVRNPLKSASACGR